MAEEREVLARQACGDIPPRYCHVVDVEINGDAATVWLLTNGPSWFEEYEVAFIREDGVWRDAGGTGGFQDGTPQRVHELAAQLRDRLRRASSEADAFSTLKDGEDRVRHRPGL